MARAKQACIASPRCIGERDRAAAAAERERERGRLPRVCVEDGGMEAGESGEETKREVRSNR